MASPARRLVVLLACVYCAVMLSRLLTVTFDAHDAGRLAQFWANMLGREVVEDAGGALLPGEDTQLSLRLVPSRAEKVGPNRMHLHLTSASRADQQHTVATALGSAPATSTSGSAPRRGDDLPVTSSQVAQCRITSIVALTSGFVLRRSVATRASRDCSHTDRKADLTDAINTRLARPATSGRETTSTRCSTLRQPVDPPVCRGCRRGGRG